MTADQSQPMDEEILVMDETGQFKVLSGGQLKPFGDFFDQSSAMSSAAAGEAEETAEENLKPILPIDTGYEEKMLQPPPPALYKKTSSFYFHPADEEEAARHLAGHLTPDGRKKYSLDKIAAKVAENYHLDLNQELLSRLRSAIFSFLRDRRSAIDTRDLLVRARNLGGMNLKPEIGDNLLEFLREIKQKIEAQSGMVVDEKEVAAEVSGQFKEPIKPIQPFAPKLSAAIPQAEKSEPSAAIPVSPTIPVRPAVSQPAVSPQPSILKPTVKTPLPDLPLFKPKSAPTASARFQRPVKEGAKRLTDVKKDYKLVGPVEELALLNLETFRRLGATPDERAQKITAKINLLAKDSLAKKAQGINAWRQSPLYRMYLAIGQASMEHSLDLVGVINEYSSQGKEIISLDEFNAITDINKQLRF